jgi:nitric oxide synthase-interacting protein
MTKHSKNATAAPFISNKEKQKTGWGTKSQRLTSDNLLPFGHCYLCTQWVQEPMISPSGHMYCKECILKNLVTQQKSIKIQKAAWKAQEVTAANKASTAEVVAAAASVQGFMDRELDPAARLARSNIVSHTVVGIGTEVQAAAFGSAIGSGATANRRTQSEQRRFELAADSGAVQQYEAKSDLRDTAVVMSAVAASSFWVPDFAPDVAKTRIPKPRAVPSSPVSGAPLRAKMLSVAHFHIVDQDAKATGGTGRYCCALTRKSITHQAAVLLKPSGSIVLKSAFDTAVAKGNADPFTGAQLQEGDVLLLASEGSGYASRGGDKLIAKSYRPGK